MSTPVTFTFGKTPVGFCPNATTPNLMWDQVWAMLAGIMSGSVSAQSSFYPSSTAPPASLQGQVIWGKTDNYGSPVPGQWLFWWSPAVGAWVWPHPKPPGSPELMIWNDIENPNLWQYDGGDTPGVDPTVTAPTAATGAMWFIKHAVTDFKMLISAGTSPASYNGQPATVLTQGQTVGEEKHVLTMDEIWHQHPIGNVSIDSSDANNTPGFRQFVLETNPGGAVPLTPNAPGFIAAEWQGATASGTKGGGTVQDIGSAQLVGPPVGVQTDTPTQADSNHPNTVSNLTPPAPSAHNLLPPSMVVMYAQRTGRIFYRGN